MGKLLGIFFCFYFLSFAFAQDREYRDFQSSYEAVYKCSFQKDSTNINAKIFDEGTLYIGNNKSLFQSRGKVKDDSARKYFRPIPDKVINYTDYFSAKFDFTIIKDFKRDEIRFQEIIGGKLIGYDEKSKLFQWKIADSIKTINGYRCRKATCRFRGRSYTAWFTDEIPFHDGPYKFSNLPGFIVKINDDKNYFSFELISFKKKERVIKFRTDIKLIKNKDFYPIKVNYLMAARSRVTNAENAQKQVKAIVYNPIEIFK